MIVSEQAILKQISRLKKYNLIKEIKIKIKKNQFIIIYEAI
jgi:hypothetical protein